MNDLLRRCWLASLVFAGLALAGDFASAAESKGATEVRIFQIQGQVEIMPAGASTWVLTQTNQVLHPGDRVRTGPESRVVLHWSDQSVVPFGAETEIEILMPDKADSLPGLNLFKGIISFFHRDKPGRIRVLTRGAAASVEGTEFVLEVQETSDGERVMLAVIDGKVQFSNAQGSLTLTNQEQAVAAPGLAPARTPGFVANNLLQWCFYYPAVLDLRDLTLSAQEADALHASLAAYRAGDLLKALASYPASRPPGSDAGQIYHAALLLSVGQVEQTEAALARLQVTGTNQRLADSLRTLIAAVKRQSNPSTLNSQPSSNSQLSTELLAASYYEQSRATGDESLNAALELARRATTVSPQFGFAWERVAELEFGFGRLGEASHALDQSLEQSPRNAQALALKGFMLAGRNQIGEAIQWFDRAIATDAALGNAWLGRGLCRIRRGDTIGGRGDLLIAAALEPQRSLLRSYLGKAYADTGDVALANKELDLALRLDPNDPTGWLYAALLKEQQNRINEAVSDLEQSQLLNDNRSLFRSRLLLDQDAAVRSANLANIYRDAGMDDVSVREATRAVSYDYANYSAHLFLADSYGSLRDPNQINLRYETPWLNEFLIANLLAPAGAGTLSRTVSQQEYSPLFERDGLHVASSTEYLSRGAWFESGSQYGNFGNTAYSFDANYLSDPGQRPNNDQEQLTLSLQFKQQITPSDSVYLQAVYYDANAGDLAQYYDQANAHQNLRTAENQEPLLLAGYHHEWSPGNHTLVVGGWFNDDYTATDTEQSVLLLGVDGAGDVIAVPTPALPTAPLDYRSKLTLYSAEVQQIWEQPRYTVILGARYQSGTLETDSDLGASTPTQLASMTATTLVSFASAPISQAVTTEFERVTGYGYLNWRVIDPLLLCLGVSYDYLQYPDNFRSPPIASGEDSASQVSPKAGFIWTPLTNTALRFAYTRSLGGVSFDQSARIEPVQVAGFTQVYRSLMPESVVGSTAGASFETFGLALDQKFKTDTYVGISAEILNSELDRTLGAVNLNFPPTFTPSGTRQELGYTEKNITVTVNQLVADWWSFGLRYGVSRAELDSTLPDIPASVSSASSTSSEATLQQLALFGLFNHPSGFFARAEGTWYSQINGGDQSALPGDSFWQVNLSAGYRFWQRRAQVQVGVLNLTDQNYQLNPLNQYRDLPRERTFVAGFQFNF